MPRIAAESATEGTTASTDTASADGADGRISSSGPAYEGSGPAHEGPAEAPRRTTPWPRRRATALRNALRNALRTGLRHEWRAVPVAAWRALRARGVAGISLALFAVVAVVGLHSWQQTPAGDAALRVLSEVRADQPFWVSLLRTPVSLFVPARDLSAWGGLPRLFFAFALGQLLLGWARTLFVAYGVTLAGTLTARLMVALGPERVGLPVDTAQAVDTGASAAIVGLFVYVAAVRGSTALFAAGALSTVIGSVARPDLAGREHLAAVAVALALAFIHRRRRSATVTVTASRPAP
ncbi:hypothetical protein [Streptomyces sp. NPDC059009]|uniref:hypothetical protein n=1 Tax=Streptomyces sp. NPDC059009 TaxID=3346694 RepID=UPI00367F6543